MVIGSGRDMTKLWALSWSLTPIEIFSLNYNYFTLSMTLKFNIGESAISWEISARGMQFVR